MTEEEFQGRVLRELGQIGVTLAVVGERQKTFGDRLRAVESWQDGADDKAEATGQHELAELRDKVKTRRAEWLGWIGKAALLVVGSALAMAGQACQGVIGF